MLPIKHIWIILIGIAALLYSGETGKISGKVIDQQTGSPLLGVNVVVFKTEFGAATNDIGEFMILNIPPSVYSVSANYIGYKTLVFQNVEINADHSTILEFLLVPTTLEGDEIIVSAKKPVIVRDQTATTRIVVKEDILNMPVNSYEEVLSNLAGVVDNQNGGGDNGIHIRGGRSGEIAYMVDGILVEDALNGGMGTDVARGAISELSVITGSFNAEYGEAMSGVVNIITAEGSPELAWSVRTVTDEFGGVKNNWQTNRHEASIGGPLLNHAWGSFFITGDLLSTDTYLQNTFLPFDVKLPGADGILGTSDDAIAMADLNFDGNLDEMKKGTLTIFDAYKNDTRLTGKLSLKPLKNLKLTFGMNTLNREQRLFDMDFRIFPDRSPLEWVESDLYYLNSNLAISKNLFVNFKYSTFRNENWSGHPDFLNNKHELFTSSFDVPDDWLNAPLEPGEDYVWLSNYAEPYNDVNIDGQWGYNAEPWNDINGNGILDEDEYLDEDEDGIWDFDQNDNGVWDFVDENEDGIPDFEDYLDLNGDGIYSRGAGLSYYGDSSYDGISNYEFLDQDTVWNNYFYPAFVHLPNPDNYTHYKSQTTTLQASLTWQYNKNHQLKTGFNQKQFDMNYFGLFDMGGGPFGMTNYNVFELWTKSPETKSLYFQDKIDFPDIVLNLGLRWDYLDPKSTFPDPTQIISYELDGQFVPANTLGAQWGYLNYINGDTVFTPAQESTTKQKWSPRIGIGYPLTDRLAFHFSYGHFFQFPEFVFMYNYANSNGSTELPSDLAGLAGLLESNSGLGSNVFGNDMYPFPYDLSDWYIPTVGSPNLKPETTIAYEFGLRNQLSNDYFLSTTLFYKDMFDYITAVIYDADPTEYAIFQNEDYANTRGVEITLQKLRSQNYSWGISYTYMRAEGNASNEYTHYWEAYSASVYGTYPAKKTITMPWDQPHTLALNFDLKHQIGFGVNIVGTMGSGLPYTPSDARGRPMDESNSGRMPFTQNFDLRTYYDWKQFNLDLRLFSDITNLFDSKNILNVFDDSGKPDDSLNPDYSQMYEFRPQWYSPPRHIEVGIEIRYR